MTAPTSGLHDDIARHLIHLEVERRLAARTLAIYTDALQRLQRMAADVSVDLRAVQQMLGHADLATPPDGIAPTADAGPRPTS